MSVFNVAVVIVVTHTHTSGVGVGGWWSPRISFPKSVTKVWLNGRSAFILNLSDGWNQTTGGFVLVDLVGHVSAHGLDLNVPGVGIVRLICKPFLF